MGTRQKRFKFHDKLLLELWEEIFLRLPLISLVRCRCVCKTWCSFIQSPSFALRHTVHNLDKDKDNLLTVECPNSDDESDPYESDPHESDPYGCSSLISTVRNRNNDALIDEFVLASDAVSCDLEVVGYVNGVLCVRSYVYHDFTHLVLSNPSIHKNVPLPLPNMCDLSTVHYYAQQLAIGYDYVRNDIKLLAIAFPSKIEDPDYRESPKLFEVYAVSEGSWRSIDVGGNHDGLSMNWHSQVFVNGAIHWGCVLEDDEPGYSHVFAFDMGKEVVNYISLPKIGKQNNFGKRFPVVFEGSLCVLDTFVTYFDLWVMKQYGVQESWSKLYKIDISWDMENLMCFTNDGEVLYHENDEMMACNVRKPGSSFPIIANNGYKRCPIFRETFVESLLLLGC